MFPTCRSYVLPCLLCLLLSAVAGSAPAGPSARPNVILIMTDDQGYGDLGVHGNPIIKTPHLDKLAGESVRVESFYVCPVCAPTRAALLTGRYNYRTGVTDTFIGRAMMHHDEVTLAEMLRAAGYHTGIFGKWHLGDCYPMRPQDQGFEEVLVHRGGGLCQPAGPPQNSYFDPVLEHNGKSVRTKGYCSDVYTDAAIEFITKHRDQPFFVYLPFNCPHSPFQIAEEYSKPYEDMSLKPGDFPVVKGGHSLRSIPANTAKVYGMVTNIDDNLGRLFDKLDTLRLRENTIVIFLTDNGPNGIRYNAGMRAHKGSVYEGGIRTTFYVRWPAKLKGGHTVDRIAAHIDVVPTILEACDVPLPEGVKIDGRSLLPLLERRNVDWPDRTLYLQWHRGDRPDLYRAFAARSQDYKLVQAQGNWRAPKGLECELYDMKSDPLETKDIAPERPEVVEKMRADYEAWFEDVARDHGYEAPRIPIGTPHDPVTILTPQDWRGSEQWGMRSLGHWEIAVPAEGTFEIACRIEPTKRPAVVHLRLQEIQQRKELKPGTEQFTFEPIHLKPSPAERLEVWIVEEEVEKPYGVRFVYVKRCD